MLEKIGYLLCDPKSHYRAHERLLSRSIFQYTSNKMQRYTVYLYLETVLHVSGGTSTHYQERIQLHLQHLVLVTLLLLPAAIVEELELKSTTRCCKYSSMRS